MRKFFTLDINTFLQGTQTKYIQEQKRHDDKS